MEYHPACGFVLKGSVVRVTDQSDPNLVDACHVAAKTIAYVLFGPRFIPAAQAVEYERLTVVDLRLERVAPRGSAEEVEGPGERTVADFDLGALDEGLDIVGCH